MCGVACAWAGEENWKICFALAIWRLAATGTSIATNWLTPPVLPLLLLQDYNGECPYSLSPVSAKSQKLLRSPRKATRKISRIPFKVLDAPELQDDFYLNLVDWSSQNVLAVGLGSCVYLWSACTSQVSVRTKSKWTILLLSSLFLRLQVTRLCDLSPDSNTVTSVSWNERGNTVAVGTHHGYVTVWDVAANKQVS